VGASDLLAFSFSAFFAQAAGVVAAEPAAADT